MAKGKTELQTTAAVITLPSVSKKAINADIGPRFLAESIAMESAEAAARAAIIGTKKKSRELISSLTLAIVRAAKIDPKAIRLVDVVTTKDDQASEARLTMLNNSVMVAIGLREVVNVGGQPKLVWTAKAQPFFPGPKDDKEMTKKKRGNESNFRHQLKKVIQTALYISEHNVQAELDKEHGVLRITGPDVKKRFGADSVLLNESQTVSTGDGAELKLKDRPSFTALAQYGVKAHGGDVKRGSNTRGKAGAGANNPESTLSPHGVLDQMAVSLISAIEKLKDKLNDANRVSLEKVRNAINVVMPVSVLKPAAGAVAPKPVSVSAAAK